MLDVKIVLDAVPDYADAYQGAREDLAIWKRRALEAESALRTEQSERVPLTDQQIDECLHLGVAEYSTLVGADEIRAFARAIEAMHGIKPTKEQS